MPRQKNTRPTHIYWLLDIRPETIAAGWVQGLPFYCGKTVQKPEKRLREHRYSASKRQYGKVGSRILECSEHIRITVLETVSPENDWAARERHWIAHSRQMFPDVMTNVSEGGEGAAGYVPTAQARQRMRLAQQNRKLISEETRAKMSAAKKGRTGRKRTSEELARQSAFWKGKPKSKETRAKISIALMGKKQSAETIEKRASKHRGMKRPLGTGSRISAATRGRVVSLETRSKQSAAAIRRWAHV